MDLRLPGAGTSADELSSVPPCHGRQRLAVCVQGCLALEQFAQQSEQGRARGSEDGERLPALPRACRAARLSGHRDAADADMRSRSVRPARSAAFRRTARCLRRARAWQRASRAWAWVLTSSSSPSSSRTPVRCSRRCCQAAPEFGFGGGGPKSGCFGSLLGFLLGLRLRVCGCLGCLRGLGLGEFGSRTAASKPEPSLAMPRSCLRPRIVSSGTSGMAFLNFRSPTRPPMRQ